MATIPLCCGTYEPGNTTCDGDPRGETRDERVSCAWRNRCAGVQIYCLERDRDPRELVRTVGNEELIRIAEKVVAERAIVEGMAGAGKATKAQAVVLMTGDDHRVLDRRELRARFPHAPLNGSGRPRGQKPLKRPRYPLAADLLQLHEHFLERLRIAIPQHRFAVGDKVLVRPGTLYPVDHSESSGYITWYCTVRSGTPLAIAMVVFHPLLACVDILLPIDIPTLEAARDEGFLGKRALKRLKPHGYIRGQLKTRFAHLNMEGVALVAEIIGRLTQRGVIPLPERNR